MDARVESDSMDSIHTRKSIRIDSKTHIFCTRVRIGRSKSFKVDDFGSNRKGVCDFLLVGHCDHWTRLILI